MVLGIRPNTKFVYSLKTLPSDSVFLIFMLFPLLLCNLLYL